MKRFTRFCLATLAFLSSVPAGAATPRDFDSDEVLNLADNCPFEANGASQDGQADTGGFDSSDPDGTGNACQCGDVDEDGDVDLRDLAVFQRALQVTGEELSPAAERKCSIAGSPDGCDSADLSALRNGLAEVAPIPDLCRALVGTPDAPAGLSAVNGDEEVLLDWSEVASTLVTGYEVYRSTSPGVDLNDQSIATTLPVASSFVDETVTNGTAYYYRIAAVTSAGAELSAEEVMATPDTPLSCPGPVTSDLSSAEIWTLLCSPITISSQADNRFSVESGASLTIEAGVEILLAAGMEFAVFGEISAVGSEARPVEMRAAGTGDWTGVYFDTPAATSAFDQVRIEDAGGTGTAPALTLSGVSAGVQFSHVVVAGVSAEAVSISGGAPVIYASDDLAPGGSAFGVVQQGTPSAFQLIASKVRGGVSIEDDDAGISFAANDYLDYDSASGNAHTVPAVLGGAIVAGGKFDGEEGTGATNKIILTEGTIGRSVIWPASRYEATQHVEVHGGGSPSPALTVEPGTEVLFAANKALRVGTGALPGEIHAVGTAANHIVFRGTASTPGHWRGVELGVDTTPASALAFVDILDAGGSGDYGLEVAASPSPALSNLNVEGGMQIAGTEVPVLETITLSDYANGPPLNLPADIVGWVMLLVTFDGADTDSVVEVSGGSVTQSATWPVDQIENFVLLDGLDIAGPDSPVLTLQAGTELRVGTNKKIKVGAALGAGTPGGLIALGTSLADGDRVDFVPNNPADPRWELDLQQSTLGTTALDNVRITGFNSPIRLRQVGSSVQLTNVIAEASGIYGVRIDAGAPVLDGWDLTPAAGQPGVQVFAGPSGLQILNSDIQGGIKFNAGTEDSAATISGNTFASYGQGSFASNWHELPPNSVDPLIAANTFSPAPDGSQIIRVIPGTLTQTATWNSDFLYEVQGGPIVIAGGFSPTLSLDPGTELRFGSSSQPVIDVGSGGKGALVVNGTSQLPVRFVPIQSGVPWGGLRFWGGALNTSMIEHAEIEEARIGVWVDESAPTIRDSVISSPTIEGIFIFRGSPTVENNEISGSATAFGIRCSSSPGRPVIRSNELSSNSDGGIRITAGCSPRVERNLITGTGTGTGIQVDTAEAGLLIRSNSITGFAAGQALDNNGTNGADARLNHWGTGATDPAAAGVVSGSVLTSPWLEGAYAGAFEVLTASALPELFSPAAAQTQFRAVFSESANWTLTYPSGGPPPLGGSGSDLTVSWGGTDEATPVETPLVTGNYEYTIQASPSGGGTSAPLIRGKVSLDDSLPFARIGAPVHLETHLPASALTVSGEVSGHTDYRFEYGVGPDPGTWFAPIASGGSGVTSPSHSWNTTALTEGVYTLRLVAVNTTPDPDLEAEDRITVKILALKDAVTASPDFFSPNSPPDGVQDVVTVKTQMSLDADWVIDLFDPSEQLAHQIAGSGAVVDEVWTGAPGTEQVYSICVRPSEGGVELVQDIGDCPTVTLDTTPPTLAISAPTTGFDINDYGSIDVTGTATDPHPASHTLTAEQTGVNPTLVASGGGDVENALLGTLGADDPNDPVFANGTLTFRLAATDAAGNSDETTTDVDVDRLFISNVAFSPLVFDPYQGGQTTLNYTLSSAASSVDITLHESGQTAPAATLVSSEGRGAGDQSETWNGSLGADLATNKAYYPVITASDGTRSVTYNSALALANVPEDFEEVLEGDPNGHYWDNLAFNGQAAQFPNVPNGINPEQNAGVAIDYDVLAPGVHLIEVCNGTCNNALPENVETVRAAVRLPPGAAPTAYWEGRLDGAPYQGAYGFNIADVLPIEDAVVFAKTPSATIDDLLVNPYIFQPIYGQVANVRIALSQPADVQIDLYDPNAAFVRTILSTTQLPAGESIEGWDGRDANGAIVHAEGFYELRVTATDPETQEQVTRTAVVQVLY